MVRGALSLRANFGCDSAISRRDASESCKKPFAQKDRGRRERRVLDAPAASRANVKWHTSIVTTGPPDSPGVPRAMVLTAYFVLSPVSEFLLSPSPAD